MKVSRRHAVVGSLAIGVAAISAAVLAVVVAAARTIVVPPRSREEDTEVVSVDHEAGTVTLGHSPDAVVDGKYSFWFSKGKGHARVGEIIARSSDTVTRKLLAVDFGNLDDARRGRFNGWFYVSPGDLDVEFEEVAVETELGPAPAWLVPAASAGDAEQAGNGKWVIQIHGRAVTRTETIRAIPVFRSAGYTSLLISYRNDTLAPTSADGRYALGDTEWKDIDAAVKYAIERGARSVVLMGWSMGGASALQALARSRHAGIVDGVVLDSPVVDWVTALDYQARARGIVRPLRSLVYLILGARWGRVFTGLREPISFARLDFVSRARELGVPILILHSDDDAYVPSTASRALAAARPDIVTFVPFADARHTKLWNHAPQLWNASISAWLTSLKPSASQESTAHRANR